MKKIFFTIAVFIVLIQYASANSINPALYQTMRANSYRNNYQRQVPNGVVPYWQAQSNYMTRGRMYQNYSDYNNRLYHHNSSEKYYRNYR